MAQSDLARPARRTLSLRSVLALLALATVAIGGMFLQYSGRIDLLVALVMNQPQRPSPKRLPDILIHVIDEQGQPVPAFQMRFGRSNGVGGAWATGAAGQIKIPRYDNTELDGAIDAVVRVDGFASSLSHFADSDREKLLSGNATIIMRKGEKVALKFRVPQSVDWPAELTPEVYFADHQMSVRIMWQPENRGHYIGHPRPSIRSVLDFNFLNAKKGNAGCFVLQLDRTSEAFYVAIHSPGFLQFFERGPFTLADAHDGVLWIDVPKPAVLQVDFDPGSDTESGSPFKQGILLVLQRNPGQSSYAVVWQSQQSDMRKQSFRLTDLAPAEYEVNLSAETKDGKRYYERKKVVLRTGETRLVDLRYKPLDTDAFRGDHTAKIHIVKPDGSPAADQKVVMSYRYADHGFQEVFSGQLSESGEIEIQGITNQKPVDDEFGSYRIEVDGHRLGYFSFTKGTQSETFTFKLPPQRGDIAPDIDLVNVSTAEHTSLSNLRGKVVCLEFWATWCGPCQSAMKKLNKLAAERRDIWRDRIVIVALSIDERPEDVALRVKQRGWDKVDHYWTGAKGSKGWNAPAVHDFVVEGVPELFIINRDGRIVWRGNPAAPSLDLASRIEELVKQ